MWYLQYTIVSGGKLTKPMVPLIDDDSEKDNSEKIESVPEAREIALKKICETQKRFSTKNRPFLIYKEKL